LPGKSGILGLILRESPTEVIIKMKHIKIVVEKHPDVYVAYPLGLKGVVIGQGDTYEAALDDVKSAIQFHVETFGPEALEVDPPILEAFVAETRLVI
jgi:predicted RNase H-like HicB family nuclease